MEVLVALALFSLIGIAGLSLLSGIVGVQDRTDGRLQRIADVQLALDRIERDILEADPGSVAIDSGRLVLVRPRHQGAPATLAIYWVEGSVLYRQLDLQAPAPLLGELATAQFSPWRAENAPADSAAQAVDVVLTSAPDAPGLKGDIRATFELASP
jgi:general secretion pathway protein J